MTITADHDVATGQSGAQPDGIRRARGARKAKASQIPLALALTAIIVAFGFYLSMEVSARMAWVWAIGLGFGLVLQRSRFCFTAALRDPVLTGGTNLTKAVVIGLAVGTVGFAALQFGQYLEAGSLDAVKPLGGISPTGIHTLVGAFIFGVGAVIAGGCASGTLMRIGEGFMQQWLVLPFFILGSGLGVVTYPFWKEALLVDQFAARVWLPELLGGFFPALVVQGLLLFAVWKAADMWSKRKSDDKA